MVVFSSISVQCYNINGIFNNINSFKYNKLHSPSFDSFLQDNKLFGLIETHHSSDEIDQLQILDFKCFQACRKQNKLGRKHGGIAVYVHNSLTDGIKKYLLMVRSP